MTLAPKGKTLLCAVAAAVLMAARAAPVQPPSAANTGTNAIGHPCDYALGMMARFNLVCPKDCSKEKGDCKDGEEEDYGTECRTPACADFIAAHFNRDTVAAFASCPDQRLPPHWSQDTSSIQRDFDHVRHQCVEPPKPAPTPGNSFELRTYGESGASSRVLVEGRRWETLHGHGQMITYAEGDITAAVVPVQVYFDAKAEWSVLRKQSKDPADAMLAFESHGGIFEANNRVSFWGVKTAQGKDQPHGGHRWKLEQTTGDIIPQSNPQVCVGWGKVDQKHGHGSGGGIDELILTTRDKCLKFSAPEDVSMRALRDSVDDVAGKVDGVAAEMRAKFEAQMHAIQHLESLIKRKDYTGTNANTREYGTAGMEDGSSETGKEDGSADAGKEEGRTAAGGK